MFKLILSLGLSLSWAGEPDDFSARLDKKAPIANQQIDHVVNTILEMAVDDYTPEASGKCNQKKMYRILDDELDRNFPSIYKALYLNVPFAGARKLSQVPYGPGKPYTEIYFSQSVKVQAKGQIFNMGLDKIDHFFSHGKLYWEIVGNDGKLPDAKVQKALDIGIAQENATWGLQTTGVKSYADLSANYHGLSFWKDLFDGSPSFFTCENGRYKITKKFETEDYFASSMDETLNCSSYASAEVYQRISKVNSQRGISCPAESSACSQMIKEAGSNAGKILHPNCFTPGSSFIEKASSRSTADVLQLAQAAIGGGGNFLIFKMFGGENGYIESSSAKGVK